MHVFNSSAKTHINGNTLNGIASDRIMRENIRNVCIITISV